MKKVIADSVDSSGWKVKFLGEHFSKRELLQLLKTVRLEYRRRVRVYRQNMTIERLKQQAEAKKVEEVKNGDKVTGQENESRPKQVNGATERPTAKRSTATD